MKKFATGIRRLEDAVRHSLLIFGGVDGVGQLYELKPYDDLLKLAYSTTFVHGSLSQACCGGGVLAFELAVSHSKFHFHELMAFGAPPRIGICLYRDRSVC
jgi:hypothetical protein